MATACGHGPYPGDDPHVALPSPLGRPAGYAAPRAAVARPRLSARRCPCARATFSASCATAHVGAYDRLVRGLPLVGLLFVASILLPLLLPAGWTIDKLGRTLAALTIFAAAYLAEVIRGGLQGVPPGQAEASKALGIPAWKTVWHIVLPQALQKVIPPLTNTAIVMVKNTSLVLIVGVFDMLSASRVAATDPDWPAPYVESYVFVAAIYFLICFGISNYARWLETRVQARSYR